MDKKIAFIFSGQGSQYVGMGKELCERYSECERVFDYANQILGKNIKELCFKGDMAELRKTENTQPAIFTVEAAIYAVLLKYAVKPDAVAGFSLGEYAALYASGVFDLTTGLYLVNQRAKAMDMVSESGKYAMGAIMGENISKIDELCTKFNNVWVANYNTQGQVSVTGERESVQKLMEYVSNLGYNVRDINVSGAFHSKYMEKASEIYGKSIELVTFKENKLPVVLNLTADYYNKDDDIRKIMQKQIYSPVKWYQSIELMINDGIDTFIEIGPGKTLCNFVKKISNGRGITAFNVENMETLSNVIDYIYN